MAKAAVEFPAGSLWPYKLTIGLLQLCLDRGLNLQTTTPALSVFPGNRSGWVVTTPRGQIHAAKIVFATNAFTSALVPELKDKIIPKRGECSAIVPTKTFSGPGRLTHTYSFRYGLDVRLHLTWEQVYLDD
jgi:glycine/D-amino acid oxidase-like deaminating enzyme